MYLITSEKRYIFISTKSKINDCRDPEDNKFLELAIDAQALFLITGDKDLLALKSLEKYQNLIITPSVFLLN
jgi:putative PIN family toxin of toxin-antitoxin system